mmetsp:Transcript_23809/g.52767  ORF Transcript_23809/g.52767 Transcript_23809/m.52767 type:complete len:264 (+) Transcript_23809:1795-2586(+)
MTLRRIGNMLLGLRLLLILRLLLLLLLLLLLWAAVGVTGRSRGGVLSHQPRRRRTVVISPTLLVRLMLLLSLRGMYGRGLCSMGSLTIGDGLGLGVAVGIVTVSMSELSQLPLFLLPGGVLRLHLLPYLGRILPEGLRGLIARLDVTNVEPGSVLAVPEQEAAGRILVANFLDDGFSDEPLLALEPRGEVDALPPLDVVAVGLVAGVGVDPTPPAAEHIRVGRRAGRVGRRDGNEGLGVGFAQVQTHHALYSGMILVSVGTGT